MYRVLIVVGLATILFVQLIVPRYISVEDMHTSFFSGVYTGVGIALMLVGVISAAKNRAVLADPEKCKHAYLEASDELNRAITLQALRATMPIMVAVLYVGLLVVGAFDIVLFWFCFGMIFLFAGCFIGFLSYFDHKM
jgi:hypothetical protein